MAFTFLIRNKRIYCDTREVYEIQISMLITEVLLAPTAIHINSPAVEGSFHSAVTDLSGCEVTLWPAKLKLFQTSPFTAEV